MSTTEDASLVPAHWCNFVFDYPHYATRKTMAGTNGDRERRVNIVPQQPLTLGRQSYNTTDPLIAIPPELLSLYRQYRPTPLRRARALEKRIGANARIYYKFEGANLSGSHKLNSALAQAYYYQRAGVEHVVTGTGAGQWGSALAYACKLMGMRCTVFMAGSSLRQKPQRGMLMRVFGAEVHSSPSSVTEVGRAARDWDTEQVGTLAVATGEALAFAHGRRRTSFAVGSGENCVLLHQTVIGGEALAQLAALGEFPDWVVACMGAGSNLAGVGLPFLRAAKERGRTVRLLAVESASCPRLTRGRYAYDVNDLSGTTLMSKMYSLGSHYVPPPIFAGGLRYHGASPFLSAMYDDQGFEALALDQVTVLGAGLEFAEAESILPAPESAHAVAGAIDLARRHPHGAPPLVLLVNISGHGLLDIAAYEAYRAGVLEPAWPDEQQMSASLRHLDQLNERLYALPSARESEPADTLPAFPRGRDAHAR